MTPKTQNRIFFFVKWLVLLLSFLFLTDKLTRFEHWDELWSSMLYFNPERIALLMVVVLLMPINWLLESYKWKVLTQNTAPLSVKKSIHAVLAGLPTGFVSPNRIGEFAGRILFLPSGKRLAGTGLSFINSLTQNLIMIFFGVLAGFFFFEKNSMSFDSRRYLLIVVVLSILLVSFLLLLLLGFKKRDKSSFPKKIQQLIEALTTINSKTLTLIFILSALRYFVFSFQFLVALHFFDVNISWQHAAVTIPLMYLMITFTPSFSAAEPAVRSSIAVLIFAPFTANTPGVLLTSITVWMINFAIPMLAGLYVLMRYKKKENA